MITAQEWLDKNYPQEIRKDIIGLNIESKKIQGSLKLEGFTKLKELECAFNQITYLMIINCPNLEKLVCDNNRLIKLNVEQAKELTYLNCFGNLLIDLDIKECPNLKSLDCSFNQLTSLDLSQNLSLEYLVIAKNNFPTPDSSFFSHLANLEELWVGERMPVQVKLPTMKKKETNIEHEEKLRIVQDQLARTQSELEAEKNKNTDLQEELINVLFASCSWKTTQFKLEIKRLKIQDLTIQIPLKKQELEQVVNNLKNSLNNSGKYLLEKLLKKQNKLLQNNETNSEKLEEMKQTLKEDLEDQEQLQNLLNQQVEVFNLEKHFESLQTSEQVAQIVHNPPKKVFLLEKKK